MNVKIWTVVKPVKRRYDASGRKEAALGTRHSVLVAAREFFLAKGYAATTMSEIAERAGVALDTVYATAGPKARLFRLLVESAISGQDDAVAAQDRDYVLAIRMARSAASKLEVYARAVTRIHGRLAPLFVVLQDAAVAEDDLSVLWREISSRRAANMREFAADLGSTGELAVAEPEAADIIWVTNSPEVFLLFTRDRQWSSEHYESWLASCWKRLLLR